MSLVGRVEHEPGRAHARSGRHGIEFGQTVGEQHDDEAHVARARAQSLKAFLGALSGKETDFDEIDSAMRGRLDRLTQCPGAHRQISDRGGAPVWSPGGRQIYYRAAGVLWAVDVTPGDPFQVGGAVPLIDPWTFEGTRPVRSYDVFPDGLFVGIGSDPDVSVEDRQATLRATELHIVLNWFEELRERLGGN